MKTIKISENIPEVSAIGLGCMEITKLGSVKVARELVEASMEAGINFFDHADIYAGGEGALLWCQQSQSHADRIA